MQQLSCVERLKWWLT